MKKHTKKRDWMQGDLLMLILCCFILILIGTLIFILPREEILERENRIAAPVPRFSLAKLKSGELAEGISDYYSDHLPFRDELIYARSRLGYAFFGGEYGGTILGKDGYLIERSEYGEKNYALIEKNISDFMKLGEAVGISTVVAVVPRAEDVMKGKMPGLPDGRDRVWELLPPFTVTFDGMLREHADSGDYVWYRTDHHYTTEGAYYVYRELADVLGYDAYPIDYFCRQAVTEDFLGTTFSASGLMSANADEITLFRYVGDDEYSVRYGDVSQNGFYDHVALEGRDKYSVFLGGNHGRTSVVKNGSVRPTLILIKDSYSHSLAPFLALHFNLELIDPRYFSDSLHTLLSDINAEKLVLFCGIDTLATADLRIVGRGE